ncbi:N-acetylglutaminylglutamine synthetase [Breoghania sp.]|uniref:N-acetylglutaminylglutamine synthetase n=1 Tax=Breoghania sp. TaxID=2065378 RepID=UPI002AA8BF85|nr:N-acetylglutaminylglutamine synthetase [Breoghania sp.]
MAEKKRRQAKAAFDHRLRRMRDQGLKPPLEFDEAGTNAAIDCGWGKLIFAETFENPEELTATLREEGPDRRDIAFHVRDPHVLLATAPQELFLDPSHTYRLNLSTYRPSRRAHKGFHVRRLATERDAMAVNVIYQTRGMVPVPPDFFWSRRSALAITVLVAEDAETGAILGTVYGIDHRRAFGDTSNGSSLWCLAVSPQAPHGGIGEALVRHLIEQFKARGCAYLDLSVMHDNEQAIALYEKLGFERVPFFTVKRKNPINEKFYAGPVTEEDLNPYAQIVVNEARRRGINVEVTDAEGGFFRLTYGGRSIHCRESLSEFTSGVAVSICDDKAVTRRVVSKAGVLVPDQIEIGANEEESIAAFLEKHGSIVVKPARGEQGRGVAIDLKTMDEVMEAVAAARALCDRVIIEEFVTGNDLRLVVIDYRVVAAAMRRPPLVVGDGHSTIAELIARQSRRREAATGGESSIPVDGEAERCLASAGLNLDMVLEEGRDIIVRRSANLHTGGTIHDVTGEVHPTLIEAAINAARAIEIPVTGIDLMVQSPREPDYRFIEANERPGLANHEPQPTAERFVDLLFPLSIPQAAREARRK